MATATYGLPPGAYERDGKYYRTIHKTGVDEQGEYEEDEEREIMLPIATDAESLNASRERAGRLGLDFYDPRKVSKPDYINGDYEPEVIGWLDRGRKRELDFAWNVGSGASKRRRYQKAAAATPKEITNGK